MKLAIIVRKDLGMRPGKIAVQVGHASVEAFYWCYTQTPNIALNWLEEGQKKIVLKINSEQELDDLRKIAFENKVNSWNIIDFGLTQVEPNTLTCIAIGPDEDEKIDKICEGLKLL